AQRAGLRPTTRDRRGRILLGDVIVAIDGERIQSGAELRLALERRKAGESVLVTVRRDRNELEFHVTLSQ
ncbi:MAG: PDZ domain-containing protein, partial [bacterium]|nr:PDZ domain-containing protein [bacterium]